tara:strand:- start:273 stop:482 length:210 start_codon:yes stop_codon:yes gene_type:complete
MKLRVILNSESLRFGVMCEAQRELDREENRIASKSKKLKKSDLPDDQFIADPRPLTHLNNFQDGARECS